MATMHNVVAFPGNPHPAWRHAASATVIILPVIRIEPTDPSAPRSPRFKRNRRLAARRMVDITIKGA